jgi:ABC-type uncharacterized transport system ATPase subunit
MESETESIVPSKVLDQLHNITGITKVIQIDKTLKVATSGSEPSVTGTIIKLITLESNTRRISQREPNLEEIFLSLTGTGLRD